MWCTQLGGNAGRKKSPKIPHLHTFAQLCRALSLQQRHVSTPPVVRRVDVMLGIGPHSTWIGTTLCLKETSRLWLAITLPLPHVNGFWYFLGHRQAMSLLNDGPTELRCVQMSVRPSVRPQSFSDFNRIWCVGRPPLDMRPDPWTWSNVKVTELLKFQKLHYCKSISSAILVGSLKLMVGNHSMGPILQLVGAQFSNSLLRRLSRDFKLRGMSWISNGHISVLFEATVTCGMLVVLLVLCMRCDLDPIQGQGHRASEIPKTALF